ncbi:MAG: extracellular solute-binding protein [Ruminiclostridium sp.]|nr:extracellular solute-binding protein [Ruminiclostridium sp.]
MIRKTKIAAALASAAILLTAGCGGGRAPAATEQGQTSAETTAAQTTVNAANVIFEEKEAAAIDKDQPTGTIKLLIYYDLVGASADLVDLFESRYGGTIDQEICSSGTAYFERLGTLVAADDSPDITRYEWASFPHGISRNMYTPIDTYIDLDSDLWSGMKNVAEEFAYNGKHYYVPYMLSSNFAINYNRKVLEEYGLSDPMELYKEGEWTWDSFRDLLRKWCDISPDHIGYTGVGAMSFIATTGTKVIDVKNTEIINNLNSDKIVRCMEFLEDIYRQGLTGEGYVDPGEAFVDGKTLFLGMEPVWSYGAACESLYKKNIDYDMAFVPFPRDPNADNYYIAYDSFGYMIPAGAKNIKGAVDWITLNREEKTDPENMAKEKQEQTDSSTKYYGKCPECKYSYVENKTEDLTECPNCGAPRKVRFNAYYSEEQYDLLQDMITPENGKFVMLFDNVNGFNADLSAMFQGSEESLLDGPVFAGASFTQLRESYYYPIETILDDYREKLKNS